MTEPTDTVFGWKGIAGVLDCSINTAKHRASEHGLPVRKVGGRYEASRSELLAWKLAWDEAPIDRRRGPRSPEPSVPNDHAFRGLDSRPVRIGLYVVGLVLVISLLMGRVLVDREEIKDLRIEETAIQALSESGTVLWSRTLPEIDHTTYAKSDHYLVRDVDADGLGELIFSVRPKEILEENGSLLCLDADGEELWSFEFGHALRVGERRFQRNFEGVFVHWIESGGRRYILTMAYHRPWYPTQLALLDPATGELLGEYLHPGQLKDFALVDLDSDPDLELLVGGINNPGPGPGRPILVALDLPFPKAIASFFGNDSARELAYLVFPAVDAVASQTGGAAVRKVVAQKDGSVMVGAGMDEWTLLHYYLTPDLRSWTFVPRMAWCSSTIACSSLACWIIGTAHNGIGPTGPRFGASRRRPTPTV